MEQRTITPVGIAHSPFKEKFGIPRQSGLVEEAIAEVELLQPYNSPEVLNDLENYGHIWLIFDFHKIPSHKWSPTVRPPRLGGNKRVGVFASRSPYRPNSLGLSLVKLLSVDSSKCLLRVSGADLMDGTPIYDIKPYLSDTEAISTSRNSWREELPHQKELKISYSDKASIALSKRSNRGEIERLIVAILKQDPRPGHFRSGERDHLKNSFAMKLMDFDLQWSVDGEIITVTDLKEEALS